MEGLNLNTLDMRTESLLCGLGFTYVGENDDLLAIYVDDDDYGDSVIVYDCRYPDVGIIKYWDLDGKRDKFLMACVNEEEDEVFPDVSMETYYNVAQMLEYQ